MQDQFVSSEADNVYHTMSLSVMKLLCFFVCLCAADRNPETYRAAVFEMFPRIKATYDETIIANVKVYEEQIGLAAQQGVQIIAFPEYGITSLHDFNETRDSVKSSLPFIDNPETHPWNPCTEPSKFANSEVLRIISCAAKSNSIVVLINILTFTTCNTTTEEFVCRPDGVSLRNSNVVFATDGSVLALYHKSHLFFEDMEANLKEKPVVFDAGFAKFGTFICFDIAFGHPAVQYVKELGVNNLIFSTAWGEELPFLTGPQLYNGWARGQEVNLIVPNMYFPNISRIGSGIFSANLGPLNYTYDLARPNRLIIADVPLKPGSGTPSSETYTFFNVEAITESNVTYFDLTTLPSSQPTSEKLAIWYHDLTVYDYVFLQSDSGKASVCQGDACCNLTYTYARNTGSVRHALIARDGPHPFGKYNWSAEVCSVVRCESFDNITMCGRIPKNVTETAEFLQLELEAELSADLLYPHILAPNLQLPASSSYSYKRTNECPTKVTSTECKNTATFKLKQKTSLLTFAIYGKFYNDYKVYN